MAGPKIKLKFLKATLKNLRKANLQRDKEAFKHIHRWDGVDWSNALAGECGELCNKTKKLKRGDDIPLWALKEEVADILIYLDIFANHYNFTIEEALIDKFNMVSVQVKSSVYLKK